MITMVQDSKNTDNSNKLENKDNRDPIKSLDRILERLKELSKYAEIHGHL